jgi:hypothetical protein
VGGAVAAVLHWVLFPPTPGSVDLGQAELAEAGAAERGPTEL